MGAKKGQGENNSLGSGLVKTGGARALPVAGFRVSQQVIGEGTAAAAFLQLYNQATQLRT